MNRLRRIVHPSDFSPASSRAFTHAVETARANRAEVVIVHVVNPFIPLTADGYVSPPTLEQLERATRAQAQKQLDRLVARARTAGARARGLLREGSAADQIVRTARSARADMIVMGTHGRGGFAKLLLGSVAERVLGHAPCPVTTVRGRK